MPKTIGLIQVKGGAGRSTLATNIAGMIAETKRVALIDCDMPQGTSASWFSVRKKAGRAGKLTAGVAHDSEELIELVEAFSPENDFIVIDAKPGVESITMAALIFSDVAVIPIEPSAYCIWATVDLVKLIERARKTKPDLRVRLVWNKFKAGTKEARELSKMVKDELGLEELETKIGDRTTYTVTGRKGLTVREGGGRIADEEMTKIGIELGKLLKTKFIKD